MLETIKRHAFLIGLAAGVVVVAVAVFLTVYFFYMGPNDRLRSELRSTKSGAAALRQGTIYSPELVEQMAREVEARRKQYEAMLDYIRSLGAARKPLVDGLFPTSTDIGLRHTFKSQYDVKLAEFMKTLNAVLPMRPEKASGEDAEAQAKLAEARDEARKHTMYASPRSSFARPEWIDKEQAPSLDQCRVAQEDLWLMEDLVGVIARMNTEVLQQKGKPAAIAHAPVKELVAIRIGGKEAVLPGLQATTGRYRPVEVRGSRLGGRLPTLSGRTSKPGFYQVLPWRLEVVVEAKYAGELLRRLRGTESFLSVEGYRQVPITKTSFERAGDLLAFDREDYGREGVVRFQVVGESLVFELKGGRVTAGPAETPPEAPAPAAASARGAAGR